MLAIVVVNVSTVAAAATVEVEVRTGAGALATRSYVALVPAWRPASRPLVEEISEKGVSLLRVPAGTYHIVAGARGSGLASRGPFEVKESDEKRIVLSLPELKVVRGVVSDHRGAPLSGARVAHVHAAIPPPLGRLSKLAVDQLMSDWTTTTDATGGWSLNVPEGTVPLLFEAPGLATEWRTTSPTDGAELEVSLSPAAILKVMTDRVDPDLVITLSQENADRDDGLLEHDRPRVRAKWLVRNELTWTSLAAGTYGVYAKYADPRFIQPAVKLATVALQSGEQHVLPLALPPPRRAAARIASMFIPGFSRTSLAAELNAYGVDASGIPQRLRHVIEPVSGGIVIHADLDGARPPLYAVTTDRFFSMPPGREQIGGAAIDAPMPLTAHPRADVHFSLRFSEEELQPPASGTAILGGCSKDAEVVAPIQISQNVGHFTAAAGCQSIVLQFDPFEPVLAARALLPGERSLGEFVLRAAGSADVRVVRASDGGFVTSAVVRASSTTGTGDRRVVVRTATTDDQGWARLSGLPAYAKIAVVAETPRGDSSESVPVRIGPRERAIIDPLLVSEPATLVVTATLDESVLTRFPAARVVTLMVRPADPDRQDEARQENRTTAEEVTRFERLRPGRWLVTAAVSVAGTYSAFEIGDVELKPNDLHTLDAVVEPNVFDGVITSEGKGVAAKVMIDDRGRVLTFKSDANGIFRAVLQEPGVYDVAAARLRSQGNLIPVGAVPFIDPDRRVEITIPATGSVSVTAVRDDEPVAQAVVWASRRNSSGRVDATTKRARTTDIAGSARFDDLAVGEWVFTVEDPLRRRSAEKSVAVEVDANVAVALELTGAASIEGTIRDSLGAPLPRARVDCIFLGNGGLDRVAAETNAEGAFAVDFVAPGPPFALCAVVGPMGGIEAFRWLPGQRIDAALGGPTGTVTISDWSASRPQELWLTAPDGRAVSLNAVAAMLGRFGSPLTLPALRAGTWRVTRIESLPQSVALATGRGASLPAIAEITVRAGTTETVQINGQSPARRETPRTLR